jgi:sugar phosphate isomerase/epimerase
MTDHRDPTHDRRQFLTAVSTSLAAAALSAGTTGKAEDLPANPATKICVFTKPFNSLSFDELADRMAELGVDGIEAPIRAGGHVEPEQVEDRLPALHEALQKRGLEITVMTSDVNDPSDRLTERVLRTAATLGIPRYRMKYFKYDLKQSVIKQIRSWQPQLRELAAMNHDFGIQGLYQNHSGSTYCGAAIWDLRIALDGIPSDDLGIAYDIRHATAEGGTSWPATFNMIQPQIRTVYVKDFVWGDGPQPINVPLGDGRVDPKFFSLLKTSGFSGPISLHEEYLDHRDPKLVPEHLAAIGKDLAKLKAWLKQA